VKYTPNGGDVTVNVTADNGYWRLRVWNNGPGISPSAQPHIFERFYRAANGNEAKISGSGLGLPIARSIAETHGGKLVLLESNAQGTTFELSLPVIDLDSGGDETQAKSLAVSM
jgi:two-component system OmpR family sensor kinase